MRFRKAMKVSIAKKNKHYKPLTCPVCEETVFLNMQMPGSYECVCGRHIGGVYLGKDGSTSLGVNMSFSGPQALKCLMNALVIKNR